MDNRMTYIGPFILHRSQRLWLVLCILESGIDCFLDLLKLSFGRIAALSEGSFGFQKSVEHQEDVGIFPAAVCSHLSKQNGREKGGETAAAVDSSQREPASPSSHGLHDHQSQPAHSGRRLQKSSRSRDGVTAQLNRP